jgi:hypothetical protein
MIRARYGLSDSIPSENVGTNVSRDSGVDPVSSAAEAQTNPKEGKEKEP